MSERIPEQRVKSVEEDNDYLCIELLNGLRLTGPLRTRPIYRERVVPVEAPAAPETGWAPAMP